MNRRDAILSIPVFFGYLAGLARGQDAGIYIRSLDAYVSSSNSNWDKRPKISIPTTEQSIHILTNHERYKESRRTGKVISQLNWDSHLAIIARRHSWDMSENDFFDHVNKNGMNQTARAEAYGYPHRKEIIKEEKRKDGSVVSTKFIKSGIGENVFMHPLFNRCDVITRTQNVNGRGYENKSYRFDWNGQESIASGVVAGWMDSPGHRRNILNPDYSREGIGAFLSFEKNHAMVTQNFW